MGHLRFCIINETDEYIPSCPSSYGHTKYLTIGDSDFSNRPEEWLGLEPEEDHDNVYVAVGEGNWSPICIILTLTVLLWLVCDFTGVTTN